ncbi:MULTISPECIES: hypothetical protein [Haloferax]|nr:MULTISPECIES: hypothetical protein [Haloferax]
MDSKSPSGGPLAVLKRFHPQRTRLRVSACVAASRSMRDVPDEDAE